MECEDIEALENLERRIAWQEQIHQKHTPQGNVFHWDFRQKDVTRLILNGVAIGVVGGLIAALTLNLLKK